MSREQLEERYDRKTGRYTLLYALGGSDATEHDKFVVETEQNGQVIEAAGFADEQEARNYQAGHPRGYQPPKPATPASSVLSLPGQTDSENENV